LLVRRLSALLTPSRRRQLWYFPLLAAAMALMMARSLVMARLLGIGAFAQFSGGVLVSSSFGMLGCLGLQTILQREWPVDILRGQELRGLVRAAQCNLVAVFCSALLVIAVVFGISVGTLSPQLFVIGLVHGCAQQIFVIATVESRSRGDALRFSWQNLARALGIITVGCLVAVWTGSAIAILAAEAVLTLALSAVLLRRSAHNGRLSMPQVYALALRRMPLAPWRASAILMAITGIAFLLVSLDRWTAAAALTARDFAAYSFAWTVPSLAQGVQQILNTTIYPTMVRRFAASGPASAFRVCVAGSVLVLAGGAVGALPLFYVLKYCVVTWYPKYEAALSLVPVFMAVAVLRVADYWSSFLLAIGREGILLGANLLALVAGVLVWTLWVYLPLPGPLQPMQAALLALCLSGVSYAVAMGCAWTVRLHRVRARVYS
jgi:O-antigen/teichoic acid export membrane protein